MITRDNIFDVLEMISDEDVKRMKNSDKEYIVLELHCFNSFSRVDVILTNDYNRYKNVSNNGNCILSIEDPIFEDLLNW